MPKARPEHRGWAFVVLCPPSAPFVSQLPPHPLHVALTSATFTRHRNSTTRGANVSQQQPNQPGWATPQQDPEPGTPQPKKKRSIGKLVGIWLLSALGLFIILGVVGSVTDSDKKASSSSDAKPSAIASVSKPAKAVVASKPSKSATPSKSVTPSDTPKAKSSATSPKPATALARKKAAAILEKEDQDFRDFLAQGETVTGTPQFTPWYQKAIVGLDMKQNAFNKADAYFTADNEPTDLLEQWRSDNGDANAAITQYAVDGLSPDAPNTTTRKDAADARAALAKADKDAEKIANGS